MVYFENQMTPRLNFWSAWLLFVLFLSTVQRPLIADEPARAAWTSSRIVGSPEPPLPFVLQRIYPQLEFNKPVSIHPLPVADEQAQRRILVCEQGGKILSFRADQALPEIDLVVDFAVTPPPLADLQSEDSKRIDIYSLAFHPDFKNNRRVVICYVVTRPGKRRIAGTHIASFEMSSTQSPQLLIESEQTIFQFDSGGHNGCTVAFDAAGLLYISTGDAASPAPPDVYDHGQNVGDVYSAILRIDIDNPQESLGYSIPPDNPFVNHPGARPEVFAYGFRNPWRMSFDSLTGDLWVGDVGWEAWEMVYRVRPGGNYGWPIKEGPGDTRPDAKQGPTPILPADVALPHSEAASVTGGVVYRGQNLKSLQGQYIFGDWVTRKFWAVEFDQEHVIAFREIAVGPVKPISFELDHDGELLILDYNSAGQSGIYRLIPNPQPWSEDSFPRRLSETGLFSNVDELSPAEGVVSYQINAPMYRDGATTQYWLAIPELGQAKYFAQPQTTFDWFRTPVILPPGSVFAKTYFLEQIVGDPASRRPVETQLAHAISLGDWNYYTYRWNTDSTEAHLVAPGGETSTIEIEDAMAPDGKIALNWIFAARTQCRTCHTPWRGETLGFIEPQLREPVPAPATGRSSAFPGLRWTDLVDGGWMVTEPEHHAAANPATASLVDPYDTTLALELRARSYLHANCSHCHLNGGNASVSFDLSFAKSVQEMALIDALPMRGDYSLSHPKLVAPTAPHRSVLLYRMAKVGTGRMPPIQTAVTDHRGVAMISQWIDQLSIESTRDTRSVELIQQDATVHALRLQLVGQSPEPAPEGAPQRDPTHLLAAVTKSLTSTSGGLTLAIAIADGQVDSKLRDDIVAAALNTPAPIAELFESWARVDARPSRLGPDFDPKRVLDVAGNAENGRQGFLANRGQCALCHQIHGQGLSIGPDLSKIGSKFSSPELLLRHIVRPSDEIAESFRATNILTTAGQVLTGRILRRTSDSVALQEPSGRSHVIPIDEIIQENRSDQSLMPEQLLEGLTAQEAADLLAYLGELR